MNMLIYKLQMSQSVSPTEIMTLSLSSAVGVAVALFFISLSRSDVKLTRLTAALILLRPLFSFTALGLKDGEGRGRRELCGGGVACIFLPAD